MEDYPWYSTLEANSNELQQGDIIPECPILMPPPDIFVGQLDVNVTLIDSVVLSQSCDLENGKIEIVLVCPYYSLKAFLLALPDPNKRSKEKMIDNLKKGNLPGYHLINKDQSIPLLEDYTVVDFRNIYGIQFKALTNVVSKVEVRHRLLPPYREHLSQAFARFFMRVGLPQDIIIAPNYLD